MKHAVCSCSLRVIMVLSVFCTLFYLWKSHPKGIWSYLHGNKVLNYDNIKPLNDLDFKPLLLAWTLWWIWASLLRITVYFSVSVVYSQVFTEYKYIHTYIYIFFVCIYSLLFLHWLTERWVYFFSTKGATILEAFSHTFLHDLLKIPQLVCHLSSLNCCNWNTVIL